MKNKIIANIEVLKKYSKESAEIAQTQLELLEQTHANKMEYLSLNEDVVGAIAAFD